MRQRVILDENTRELICDKSGELESFGLYSDRALNTISKQWIRVFWNNTICGKHWESEDALGRRKQLNGGKGGLEPELLCFFSMLKATYKKIWVREIVGPPIGHLAANTELYFRQESQRETEDEDTMRILYSGTCIANNQLYNMIKRRAKEFVLESPYVFWVLSRLAEQDDEFYDFGISKGSWLKKYQLPLDIGAKEWDTVSPQLQFNEDEQKKGENLLRQMGVNSSSYVCIHSRDDVFIKVRDRLSSNDLAPNAIRNCNIDNYMMAAEYLAKENIAVLRMGAKCEKKIKPISDNIIDYAELYRSDFGDVFLPAHCKFFLGCASGLSGISTIFNIPVAAANFTSFTPQILEKDIYIFKKFWSIEERRFLSFRELLDIGADKWLYAQEYEKAGVMAIENSPEEILALAIEMNQKIDGTWIYTQEETALQQQYRELFPAGHLMRSGNSKIGTNYLKQNPYLLR